jgi:hypothetical protein
VLAVCVIVVTAAAGVGLGVGLLKEDDKSSIGISRSQTTWHSETPTRQPSITHQDPTIENHPSMTLSSVPCPRRPL